MQALAESLYSTKRIQLRIKRVVKLECWVLLRQMTATLFHHCLPRVRFADIGEILPLGIFNIFPDARFICRIFSVFYFALKQRELIPLNCTAERWLDLTSVELFSSVSLL